MFGAAIVSGMSCQSWDAHNYLGHWEALGGQHSSVDVSLDANMKIVVVVVQDGVTTRASGIETVEGSIVVPVNSTFYVMLKLDEKSGRLHGGELDYERK